MLVKGRACTKEMWRRQNSTREILTNMTSIVRIFLLQVKKNKNTNSKRIQTGNEVKHTILWIIIGNYVYGHYLPILVPLQ